MSLSLPPTEAWETNHKAVRTRFSILPGCKFFSDYKCVCERAQANTHVHARAGACVRATHTHTHTHTHAG